MGKKETEKTIKKEPMETEAVKDPQDAPKVDFTEPESTQVSELEQAQKEAEDYKNALIRERADFENYKKRIADSSSKAYADGVADTVLLLLPVLDNLERALSAPEGESLKTGVEMIQRQLIDSLKGIGLSEIDADGAFDPNVHNAIMQVEPEEGDKSGDVKEVLQRGYKLKDQVLRYSMVKVIQ